MQLIQKGYRVLQVVMSLNWDRVLYVCVLIFALLFGAWVGTQSVEVLQRLPI